MNGFLSNSDINSMARQTLKGQWFKTAVLLFGLLIVRLTLEWMLSGVFKGIYRGIYAMIEIFISAFIILWWFKMVKYNDKNFDHSAEALKKFGNFAWAGILYFFVIAAGYLLFIIPGIIFQFSYALVFWIVADEPAMPVIDAMKLSRKMMKGYKWKLFCLNFRFIGWYILSIFTLGIGFLFVIPYQACANIHFYRNVKAAYEAENGKIQATEYQGMSPVNTALTALLVFVWNSGFFYLISLLPSSAS